MAYSHGIHWSNELIKEKLDFFILKFNLKVFPSMKELRFLCGNSALSCAISKRGGFKYWADKMNLPLKKSETSFGEEYEEECFKQLWRLGYVAEHMSTRFPYDLTANKHIKIDVKVGKLYTNQNAGSYYSFNLEKKSPTCDIFVCYCVNENFSIDKVYVIPSKVMYGKKQLSVGQKNSVYDIYQDNWDILKAYDEFYKQI